MEIRVQFTTYGEVSSETREAIGGVLDTFSEYAPDVVGGDPPRRKLDKPLAEILHRIGPPDFLIGGRRGDSAGKYYWDFDFTPEWTVAGDSQGSWIIRGLSSIEIVLPWNLFETVGARDNFRAFFAQIGDACQASYGMATTDLLMNQLDQWYPQSTYDPGPDVGIGTVHWLQYFGPAFTERYPALRVVEGAAVTSRGGVIYEASEALTHAVGSVDGPISEPWQKRLVHALDVGVFDIRDDVNPTLPTQDDHAKYVPGSGPPPGDLVRSVEEAARKREAKRIAAFQEASARRLQLDERRRLPANFESGSNWSINIDSDQVDGALKAIFRNLGVQLSSHYSAALRRELSNTPHGENGDLVIASDIGPFKMNWFADSEDSVILSFTGAQSLVARVERILTEV